LSSVFKKSSRKIRKMKQNFKQLEMKEQLKEKGFEKNVSLEKKKNLMKKIKRKKIKMVTLIIIMIKHFKLQLLPY